MSILVTDRRSVWLWDLESGRRRSVPLGAAEPCAPAAAAGLLLAVCARDAQVYCASSAGGACVPSFAAMPGPCALCASPCGRYAYLLGEDTDCVHTRCLRTGELLFAQRAGVFPRGLRLHPSGRWLAVAGGASGEALVLAAPELSLLRRVRVRGAVCAVDFVPDGLLLLCAVGDSEPRTALVYASGECPRAIWYADGPPGDLRAVGSGAALAGAWNGLSMISLPEGRTLWHRPELPMAARIELDAGQALVSRTINGMASLLPLRQPWLSRATSLGADTEACFVPRA